MFCFCGPAPIWYRVDTTEQFAAFSAAILARGAIKNGKGFFWTASLFFDIGLYAEPNVLVDAALTFGALAIAFAIFLILEIGQPYTGLLKVTRATLEQTIEYVDK